MNIATVTLICVQALKLKRAEYRESNDGLRIIQRGRPVVTLLWSDARDFANQVHEADHD